MEIGKSFLVQHYMDTVWLMHPEKLRVMTDVLLKKASGSNFDGLLALSQNSSSENERSGMVQRVGSTAILNIEGVMVPKCSWIDSMCGFVSTLTLHSAFNALVADPSIGRIVLYLDTPGGSSTGIPEFAESIFNARSEKEIVAFTDVVMASAGYWLGAAAEKIVSTPSAVIGSIGTYIPLIKYKMEGADYDVHYISAGENKLFGAPDIKISEAEVDYFKEKIAVHYTKFTDVISKYRGVSSEDVIGTKASWYSAEDAPTWMYDELSDSNYVLS